MPWFIFHSILSSKYIHHVPAYIRTCHAINFTFGTFSVKGSFVDKYSVYMKTTFLMFSTRWARTRFNNRYSRCRCACKISKRCDNLNCRSLGLTISRGLLTKRLIRYWNGPQIEPMALIYRYDIDILGHGYTIIYHRFCWLELFFHVLTSISIWISRYRR